MSLSKERSDAPRLQKVLASAGFGSRRSCETLILEGRVEVDRSVVTELGTRVDPERQQVRVDGVTIKLPRFKYFMLHKPTGVVSTARDPWARTRVIDLVEDPDRLFTVGRLDKSSSGLILVTNDGDLAHKLTHPSFRVEKTYRVQVAGRPSQDAMRQMRRGIYLADGKARVERIALISPRATQSTLEIVLSEGRNREIRRLLARVGHKVQQLRRIAFGPLRLGELPVGAYRELTHREVGQLRLAGAGKTPTKSRRKPRKSAKKKPATATSNNGPKRPVAGQRGKRGAGKPTSSGGRKPRTGAPARAKGRKANGSPNRDKGTVIGGD